MDHHATVRSAKAFEPYDLGAEGQAGLFAFPTITSATAAIQQNAFRRQGRADLADQPGEVKQAKRLIAAVEAQEDPRLPGNRRPALRATAKNEGLRLPATLVAEIEGLSGGS